LPKLPPEARLCIWKLASFLPRDLDVWIRTMDNIELSEIGGTFEPFRFVSSHPVPAILHISKEAWDIGLKHYEALFWNEREFETFTFSTPDHRYCNPSSDRMYFLGPVNKDAMFQINACIDGYALRCLAFSARVIRYQGTGEFTVNLQAEVHRKLRWLHGKRQ
jgi:hypothetical protein